MLKEQQIKLSFLKIAFFFKISIIKNDVTFSVTASGPAPPWPLCPAGASGQERKLYLVPGRAMSRTFYVNVR